MECAKPPPPKQISKQITYFNYNSSYIFVFIFLRYIHVWQEKKVWRLEPPPRQLNGLGSRTEIFLSRAVVKGLSRPQIVKLQFFSILPFQTKTLVCWLNVYPEKCFLCWYILILPSELPTKIKSKYLVNACIFVMVSILLQNSRCRQKI